MRETSTNSVGRRTVKKREKKQVMKRKMKSRSSVDDDSQDSWPSPSAPTTPSATTGNLMQLRQWIENYEEAVTNHYSPELRARISNMRANGQNHSYPTTPTGTVVGGVGVPAPPTAQQDVQVQKCRLVPQPLTGLKIVTATALLPPNSAVIELRGKYMLSTQHRQLPQGPSGGLLTRQHSQQRPGPFLFFYRLPKDGTEVCVDTRTYGNDARFIRRSCRPNAELRHCVEKGTLHLYVVTVSQVEKSQELTIRHETHDLAAVGTTNISCACGNPQTCGLFHNQRKNGGSVQENIESTASSHRKRRGRRTSSPGLSSPTPVEPVLASPPVPSTTTAPAPAPPPAVTTRRSSHHSTRAVTTSDTSDRSTERREPHEKEERESSKDKKKKLTREERKMEAIMKAFERMEKAQQRKQEVQARQAQRRESEPAPSGKHENGDAGEKENKTRRKRRKGRARTVSTTSQSNRRRTRLNSTDSYVTSGDESSLLSPPLPSSALGETLPETKIPESPLKSQGSQISDISSPGQVTTAAGLLLALASGGNQHEQALSKSPQRENDGNSSSSSIQSSPSTPLSSACLLVAAAVGPLEPGFKFPKTKKAIMNEWLNKSPEPLPPASSVSPLPMHTSPVSDQVNPSNDYYAGPVASGKNLATLVQAASLCDSPPQTRGCERGGGNAKKRWLRQAISEECDSPCSRPESPPSEMVAPPKKRRLARESLSSEQSFTPPTTPTMLVPPSNSLTEEDYPNNDEEFYTNEDRQSADNSPPDETDFGKSFQAQEGKIKETGRVEIVYSGHDVGEDLGSLSEQPEMESDAVLKERVAEMRMEFGNANLKREEASDVSAECEKPIAPPVPAPSLLDPRLGRCDHTMFRDSAQLLGTVEKTIRFYEENFATPGPIDKEEKEKKPEIVTPAKRKVSFHIYTIIFVYVFNHI